MNVATVNNLAKSKALVQLMTMILISGLIASHAPAVAAAEKMLPAGGTEYRVMNLALNGGGRRRLTPFQLCLLCKCCAGPTCVSMPCCFGIDCQLPNKPFGVCAFVPKVCNCTNCVA